MWGTEEDAEPSPIIAYMSQFGSDNLTVDEVE